MKLPGDAEREFVENVNRQIDEAYAQELVQAKEEATARGKEPFDLAELDRLCDTTNEGILAPFAERHKHFEYKYYVQYPTLMTLVEFAAKVTELSRW